VSPGPAPGHGVLPGGAPATEPGAEALARRAVSPYTTRQMLARALWNSLGQRAFRLTFHNWYRTRNRLLRLFGARIAEPVRLRPSVIIEQPWHLEIGPDSSIGDRAVIYCLGRVTIGAHVSISQHAHLCAGTHDHTRPDLPLLRPPITINDHAWIAADAFVGPGVTVGAGAILGARGCAFRDLEPWTIYGGNPARPLRARARFDAPRPPAGR